MKIYFLAIILFVQGCATTQGIVAEKVTSSSKLFVVSQLDSQFDFIKTGTTAFNNKRLSVPIEDWGINQYVEHEISNRLRTSYVVVTENSIKPQLSIPSDNYLTGYPSSMKNEHGLQVLKDADIDFVLFITPVEFQDAYFETNQFIKGLGIYQRSFLGSSSSILFAQISFTLFDVSTGKFIASNGDTGSEGGNSTWINHQYVNESLDSVSENLLKNKADSYKDNLLSLVITIIDRSLSYMGFQR